MHEMSIAVGLIDEIITCAQNNNLTSINTITIETGFLRQIVPEVMQEAFRAVKENTIASKATLVIIEVPAEVVCNKCGKNFQPQLNDFTCSECLAADVRVIKGDDIIITEIQGKAEGE